MAGLINRDSLKNIWAKSGFDTLNTREKLMVSGGLLFIVCFILFQLMIVPFLDAWNNLEKSTERKKQELIEIKELQKEYLVLKSEEGTIQARINKRGASFSLFTFLDRQAEATKVKKQIKYMKPSRVEGEDKLNETMMEMKFQQIPLESLVAFLRLIESEKNVVFIRRISIQESGKDSGLLDSILQIVTFEEKQ